MARKVDDKKRGSAQAGISRGRSPESYRESRNPVPRILTLFDILMKFSSEARGLTRNEILIHGYPPMSTKTFHRDIEQLGDWVVRKGHQYYFTGHSLDRDDLMLLMDLARTSRALSDTRVDQLIAGIRESLAPEDARFLESVSVATNTPRPIDDEMLVWLRIIRGAIFARRKISFLNFDYTLEGVRGSDRGARRMPRKGGRRFRGTPLHLTLRDGFYHLTLMLDGSDEACDLRLDRMSEVRLEDAAADKTASEVPHTTDAVLRFDESATGGIVDRFGEELVYRRMKPGADGTAELIVSVIVDDRFHAWVAGFSGHVRILRPKEVRERYLAFLRTALEAQEDSNTIESTH